MAVDFMGGDTVHFWGGFDSREAEKEQGQHNSYFFTRALQHGSNWIHTAPPISRCRPPRPPGLNLGTCYIQDGRGFGLPQSFWDMHLSSYDLILLTEKNITEVAYYHNHMGHNGVCSQLVFPMVRGAQGGVGLVVRELPEGWGIK